MNLYKPSILKLNRMDDINSTRSVHWALDEGGQSEGMNTAASGTVSFDRGCVWQFRADFLILKVSGVSKLPAGTTFLRLLKKKLATASRFKSSNPHSILKIMKLKIALLRIVEMHVVAKLLRLRLRQQILVTTFAQKILEGNQNRGMYELQGVQNTPAVYISESGDACCIPRGENHNESCSVDNTHVLAIP